MNTALRTGASPNVQGAALRPGNMTTAMRAAPEAAGPKVLRIGKVQEGRIVEERVIKQRSHVTVGTLPSNVFVTAGPQVPDSVKLFERVGEHYVLNVGEDMSGRIATDRGVLDIAEARRVGERVGAFARVRLDENARGKVTVGDSTFLFQFIVPPAAQPKAQLPIGVTNGAAGHVDIGFTIIAAFSFLAHFGLAGAVNSDWLDPVVDEDAATAALIQSAKERPAPPMEDHAPVVDTNAKDPKDPSKTKGPSDTVASNVKNGPSKSGPTNSRPTPTDVRALNNDLDALDFKAIGALRTAGPGMSVIMKPGAAAADGALDKIAERNTGVEPGSHLSTGPSGRPILPGETGSDLTKLGDTRSNPTHTDKPVDSSDKVKVPGGDVKTEPVPGGGKIDDPDRVIASNRWRFKSCYTKTLSHDDMASGTVRVTVTIGEGGEVANAAAASSTAPSDLTSCVVSSFYSMKFGEPKGGGTAQLTVPIVFAPRK